MKKLPASELLLLVFVICAWMISRSGGVLPAASGQLQQQQRPDAVRHEMSRLNHATRLLPAASVASVSGSVGPFRSRLSAETTAAGVSSRLGRLPRFVRQQQQQQQQKVLRVAVLAPSDRDHQFCLSKILPAITLAARTIERSSANGTGPLPGWHVQIVDRDTKCSSIHGPLEAIELYNQKALGRHNSVSLFYCSS